MKKILSCSLVIMTVTVTSSAFSQELAINTKKQERTFSTSGRNEQSAEIRYTNDVNGKVLKSFYKSFGEKPDAKWSKTENGFAACFTENNVTTNVYFLQNGTIDYKVRYYFEEQLPKNIRHTVKSNFYDYSIIQVSEVHKDGATCFFVKAEGKASVKTIRVFDEEWEVVEELVKQ